MKIINGENLVLGRVASRVAKAALLGDDIALINCEKLMITGNKQSIMQRQRLLADMKGKPRQGRFYETRPDLFVSKVIRGMLPIRTARGREAVKHIRCYISVPDQFTSMVSESFEEDHVKKLPHLKYISIAEICRLMGGTWHLK